MTYKDSDCWQAIVKLNKDTVLGGKQVLGNFSLFPRKTERLHELAKQYMPKTILEIGLNCGHSAAIMLDASPNSQLTSFDIGDREYINKAAETIKTFYSNFVYIKGDSKKTVPSFTKNSNIKIDFALIDGDHTYQSSLSDITSVITILNPGGIIIIDDLDIYGIRKATLEIDWSNFDLIETIIAERITKDKYSEAAVYRRKL